MIFVTKSQQNNENEARPAWAEGLSKALRCFIVICVLCLFWLIIGRLDLVNRNLFETITLVLAVMLFVLGLPISALLRIDDLFHQYGITGRFGLVIALVIVLLNFSVIGAIGGVVRARCRRANPAKRGKRI